MSVIKVYASGNTLFVGGKTFPINSGIGIVQSSETGTDPATGVDYDDYVIIDSPDGEQLVVAPYNQVYKEDGTTNWGTSAFNTVVALRALFTDTNPDNYGDADDIANNASQITAVKNRVTDTEAEILNIEKALKFDKTSDDRGIYYQDDKTKTNSLLTVGSGTATIQGGSGTAITITEASPGVQSFSVAAGPQGNEVAFEAVKLEGKPALNSAALNLQAGTKLGFGHGTYSNTLGTAALTAARSIQLPDASGTVALTTDIPLSLWTQTGNDIYYNTGNVGIGTAAPSQKLEVEGNARINGALQINDPSSTGFALPTADGNEAQILSTDGAGNVSWIDGYNLQEQVKNVSGSTLYRGTPVHVTGSTGQQSDVVAANATTNYPAHYILDEDLTANASGRAVLIGAIQDVDLTPFGGSASNYSEADTVYLGASGGFTTTKPSFPNKLQQLGVVLKVNTSGNQISGMITGMGQESPLLGDLNDVTLTNPATGQLISYNAAIGWYNVDSLTNLQSISTTSLSVAGTATVNGALSASELTLTGSGTGTFSVGSLTSDLEILSTGNVRVLLDNDNNETGQSFTVQDPSDTIRFEVTDTGVATFNNAYSLPNADGTTGQVLSTDGSGAVTWVDQSGGGGGGVTSVNGDTGPAVVLDSDDISEGSTNLYMTSAERAKLLGIEAGAEVNVQSDWNAVSGDAVILNKPDFVLDEQYEVDELKRERNVTIGSAGTTSSRIYDAVNETIASDSSTTTGVSLLGFWDGSKMTLQGMVAVSGAISNPTAGAPLYLGTSGSMTHTAPTTSGYIARVVGHYVVQLQSGDHMVYFNPSNSWVEID